MDWFSSYVKIEEQAPGKVRIQYKWRKFFASEIATVVCRKENGALYLGPNITIRCGDGREMKISLDRPELLMEQLKQSAPQAEFLVR